MVAWLTKLQNIHLKTGVSGQVETGETVHGAGTIETETYSLSAF